MKGRGTNLLFILTNLLIASLFLLTGNSFALTITGSETITTNSSAAYTAEGCNGSVTWSASGTGASINQSGTITTEATACGAISVTARCSDGSTATKDIRTSGTGAGQWILKDSCGSPVNYIASKIEGRYSYTNWWCSAYVDSWYQCSGERCTCCYLCTGCPAYVHTSQHEQGIWNDCCPEASSISEWQCLPCTNGQSRSCYSGASETKGVGICQGGTQTCTNGQWGSCVGEVPPQPEICGDNLDNNCNGQIDEGCDVCASSQTQPCCTDSQGETCKQGIQTCSNGQWTTCQSQPETGENGKCVNGTFISNNIPTGSTTNIASGNLYHTQNIHNLALSYNSLEANTSSLGKGWTHNWNIQLTTNPNGILSLKEDDGSLTYFKETNGTYYPYANTGDYTTITKNPDGSYTQTTKDSITYTFDSLGKLISIKDLNDNTTTLTYDQYGRLYKITDQNGRVTNIITGSYKIANIQDPKGNTYTLTYTSEFLTQIKDPLNNTWQFTYDTAGKMLTKKDPGGYITTYTYDSNGRLLTTTDLNGKTKTITYDQPNNQAAYTEKDSGTWTQTYDPLLNLPLEKTDPYGGKTKYQYDSHGNLIKQQILNSNSEILNQTIYTYDQNGNMLTKTDFLGSTTTYTYNALNKITQAQIQNSNSEILNKTKYEYDSKGNLLKQQNLDSNDQVLSETNYQYDTKGNITQITDPKGAITQITYDTKNNLTQIKDPANATTNIQYDANGNITQITDANNAITKYEYNSLNKLTKITDANNQITQYQYDANGNIILMTDANAKTTAYQYNYLGQITQQTDSLNGITTYTYGSSGCPSCMGADKLTALTDAKTNTTQFTYDLIGRLTNQTDPMAKQTSYTYDTQGNLTSKTDPNGNTIQYTYDALNRLIQKTYPDASTTTYAYDAIGNLTSASNAYISYTFAYDALGRMTQSCIGNPASCIVYAYDANSNRTSMTSPIGTTSYVYNALNLLTSLSTTINSQLLTFNFAYDSLGRRTSLSMPNNTITSYSYDTLSRLTNLSTLNSQLQTINSNIYTYDNVGNKLSKQDLTETNNYTYDSTYQLLQVTTPTTNAKGKPIEKKLETYTYDTVGNRLIGPKQNHQYTSNANNQITQIQNPNNQTQNTTYTYDNNGNRYIETETNQDGVTTTTYYSYDYEGRLTRVEIRKENLQKEITYTYDPFGRRLSKTIHKEEIDADGNETDLTLPRTIYYLYDNEDIIIEYNQRGKITAQYTHGPGIDEPLAFTNKKGETYFYHADALGSIAALSDSTGTVVQTYDYDSFGNMKKKGNIVQPYAFTGREYDSETGTYHYRARTFDQKTGTFISKDPIGFAGGDVNLYRYVGNDPVNYIDPEGLWRWYGNWGGPNWTGGKKGTWNSIDRSKIKPPIDKQDSCYMGHDICYGACRTSCESKGSRASCFKLCDRLLANCLAGLGNDPSNNWSAKTARQLFERRNPSAD